MMVLLRRFLIAASYVTCLPVPSDVSGDAGTTDDGMTSPLAGLAKYLPAVGLLIGAFLGALAWAIQIADVDRLLAAVLLASFWLIITNGIHFDGLMDTADGIFSHQPKERMLEIMSDPRAGNFGIMTGFIVFLIKVAALNSLSWNDLLAALVLIPAWGRFAEIMAIGFFDYAKPRGKGKVWHDTMKMPGDLVAGAIPAVAATVIFIINGYWSAAVAALAAILSGLILASWLSRKVGGQTGDTYGAVVEIAETAALVLVALA